MVRGCGVEWVGPAGEQNEVIINFVKQSLYRGVTRIRIAEGQTEISRAKRAPQTQNLINFMR